MKDMSYRDKMVILVISIIVILVAGFFALIRPKYQALVADTSTYESTKTEWEGIEQKINAIPTLKDTITDTYNGSKKVAEQFVNDSFTDINENYRGEKFTYLFDQSVQELIDECELQVIDFQIAGPGESGIPYVFKSPALSTYALIEYADVNGKYAEQVAKIREQADYVSGLGTVSVMNTDLSLRVRGTRENLMTFLDKIKENENAINVSSLAIQDFQFSGGTEVETVGEDGQVTVTTNPNAEGDSELQMTIAFYNAKMIDKPELGD